MTVISCVWWASQWYLVITGRLSEHIMLRVLVVMVNLISVHINTFPSNCMKFIVFGSDMIIALALHVEFFCNTCGIRIDYELYLKAVRCLVLHCTSLLYPVLIHWITIHILPLKVGVLHIAWNSFTISPVDIQYSSSKNNEIEYNIYSTISIELCGQEMRLL